MSLVSVLWLSVFIVPLAYFLSSKLTLIVRVARTIVLTFLAANIYFYVHPTHVWQSSYLLLGKLVLTVWVIFLERNTLKNIWLKVNRGTTINCVTEELAREKHIPKWLAKILAVELYVINRLSKVRAFFSRSNSRI